MQDDEGAALPLMVCGRPIFKVKYIEMITNQIL